MTTLSELAWTQCWQVTAVAAGVGLFTRVGCRQRPHLAYALWLVVLLKCLTPPLWSSPTSVFSWAARQASVPGATASVAEESATILRPVSHSHPAAHHGNSGTEDPPALASSRGAQNAASELPPQAAPYSLASATSVPVRWVLAIVWLFGASAYATYAFLATISFWRTIRTRRIPAGEPLASLATNLASRLGIRRAVRLCVTRDPLGPLACGWLRPIVVMPQALASHRSTHELEPLLAHELVHVRRGDALVGLLQVSVQCLWWFHPLIWWANRRIAVEREKCCDEEVVAGLAFEPARYARSLLNVLELKRQLRPLPTSPGARPFEITQRRLEHIMLHSDRFRTRAPRRDWLTLLVLALFLIPGAGLSGWSDRSLATTADEPPSKQNLEPQLHADNTRSKKFNPAEAEMHVIGVYQGKQVAGNEHGRVNVEVRPTPKPAVLVLTSYFSVDWHIKLADGARIKKVILSGYNEQEIKGLPAEVPIENSSYYPSDGSRRKNDWFWASEWNAPQSRAVMRRLNALTGLPLASFQGTNEGDSFVVDGIAGRMFSQDRLPPVHPAASAENLLAQSADADLHVVGMYQPGGRNRVAAVDVEVRATPRPVVLVLTSNYSAIWNVKLDPQARIKAVILGSPSPQEVDGLSSAVPVHYFCPEPSANSFEDKGSSRGDRAFYAYQWNTVEYRRMLEKLNDVTGRLVASFQGEYMPTSFLVEGRRGGNFAQKERQTRPERPKDVTPVALLAASSGADLQVVSIYGPGPGLNGRPVDVEVRPTAKPVVLALASYFPVLWNVKIATGATVKAVIVGGYSEQEIQGVPPGIPFAYRTYYPSRNEGFFWGFDWNSKECRDMVKMLNDMTGRPVSTFQGEERRTSFVVDGTRGRNFAQTEPVTTKSKSPAAAGKRAQPREDPLADVADIPSQELQAGGDADKSYMLIGPKKNAKPPAEGYGLLVIMPGGDGSADFHPFVKRIFKNALPDHYLAAQPIAVKWVQDQKIVWPTKSNPTPKMKFATEEFVEAVIDDIAKNHKLDRTKVFSLSWSSSGPAAYATSLQEKHSVRGSFIAMSVFNPKFLPPLKNASGHAYYLYHSQQDRICPFRMAEQAKTSLTQNGAKLHLQTYDGGHGWRGNLYEDIREGIIWLAENSAKAGKP
jgi:beta-lactamase regulating signal transducer with metallopeptidase domain/predicted esterase